MTIKLVYTIINNKDTLNKRNTLSITNLFKKIFNGLNNYN